jgi:hypothetical protein
MLYGDVFTIGEYPLKNSDVYAGVCEIKSASISFESGFVANLRFDFTTSCFREYNGTWNQPIHAETLEEAVFVVESDYFVGKHARCYNDDEITSWTLSPWKTPLWTTLDIVGLLFPLIAFLLFNSMLCWCMVDVIKAIHAKLDEKAILPLIQ